MTLGIDDSEIWTFAIILYLFWMSHQLPTLINLQTLILIILLPCQKYLSTHFVYPSSAMANLYPLSVHVLMSLLKYTF